jgi:hypothetical protein
MQMVRDALCNVAIEPHQTQCGARRGGGATGLEGELCGDDGVDG